MVKTKPTKHKGENTFKFQTFSERLSAVNVDVVHRLDSKRNTVPEETETFFYECLEKWTDLNCTEGYSIFCYKLGRDVQSLGQLLLHEERITALLLEHIHKDNVLYLEPLLELVVAIAKDLQSNFYPKFEAFFNRLVELLQTRDPQIVEWTFTALAYLYKSLWRLLVKDVSKVYELLLPLLAADKPDHIQLFASESFAFIGKKVSDPSTFINLVFSKLKERPEDRLGVGQLLFHLVKGVTNQFHTRLETFLPIYFKSLSKLEGVSIQDEAGFQAVEHCFLLMARHTSTAHCSRVWKLLLGAISSSPKPGVIGPLLLLHQWISFKEGELVNDGSVLADLLISLVKNKELTEEEQTWTSKATAALMMSPKVLLPLELTSRLANLVYTCHSKPQIVLDFTLAVVSHGLFESHLLPLYIIFCHTVGQLGRPEHAQVLGNLARVITIKRPQPKSGYDIDSSKIYPIEFSFAARKTSGGKNVPEIIRSILDSSLELMITEDFPLYVNALVCLPHVRPIDAAQGTALLKKVITGAAQLVKSIESGEPKVKRKKIVRPPDFAEKLGLVLSLAMLAIRHFSTDLKEILPWNMVKFAFLNETTSKNLFYLRAADFYLTTLYESEGDDFFTLEMLTQLYDSIGENVYSPYREVRLLSLHIFSLFSPPMPTPPENIHPSPVFQICLRAEMVPATVTEQREKMKHLHNLEADRVIHSLPLGGHFNKVPLQYLLSQLFINFRPLWEPLLVLIESHAFSMDPSQFWSVYLPFVERLRRWQPEETSDPSAEVEYLNLGTTPDRLDVLNVRSLVWKGLSKFGDVTEKQNDILVPLFLDFWNNEYAVKDGSSAQTQDLTCTAEPRVKEKGNILQLLSSYLSVLASFKNPQKMVREPEVNTILLRLLSHRSNEIQKLALDCIFNYGYSYLNPYKENLYRLLDDKSFRTELTSFSVDDENSTIQADHRPGLTPIMIRMLYGKMMHKAGLGSTGKENTKHRQSVILRFIAGFTDSEIDVFLDLAFQLFSGFVETENIYQHVERVMSHADPTKALPLKRIEGALNLMGTIFSKLGNLMKSTLPKLLNILLSTFAHVTGLLSHRDRCEAKHKNQFKALRTLCMQRITQFFTKFEQYPWSPPEIEAVFHVCVWPQLEFLSDQALNGPTPLMRLFQVWAENNRYFVLLGKRHPKRSELNVLSPLLDLLTCGKANTSVCSFIMEMVDKLVTTADYGGADDYHRDDIEEAVMIRPDFCFEVPPVTIEDHDPSTRPNFGTLLLMPHLSPILSYLRKALSHGLNGRDLNILMRISEFVTDPHLSGELARLIAPAIKNMATRSRNTSSVEDKLTRYLDTLTNLMKSAEKPQQYVGILAPLFGSIEGGLARSSLCNVLEVICERDPAQGPLGKLVASLNSLDKQRVDQPDFNLRLATHKEINAILEKDYPSLEWAALVLYNSFHFVRKEEDISLKDNASFTLQQMTSALARWKFGKVLLNDHFLPQLRILIRSSNETVRHEAVSILGQTVLHCGALNAAISSMKRLRKPGDSETDFFENSRHLQTHRRSRALLRLVGYLKQDKKAMNAETITHFLLPLATCYLFNEEYAKHNHLVDAALECLQAIACCLSWSNYEKLLRFYLANMTKQYEYQKQAVKAVVVILNAFHFDLKNSTYKSFYRFKAENEPITIETIVKAPADDSTEVEKEADVEPVLPEMEPEQEEGDKSTTDAETATKIHSTISQQLLPALHSILTSRSKRELQHKSNQQDRLPEEDEILRVPIALALVNLLKNLPAGALDRSLPGMLSKVITFLKSRGNVVRDTARDTLIQMVVSLGPQCLSAVMDAANPILQRGFQVHVYIYTLHAILAKLGELGQLKAGSLDEVVAPILELCKKELYGDTADEKEVVQITNKVKEAKGVKAYDTLQILSKYVSQSHLLQLVLPMKEILASTKSFKMAQKVEECLMNIATGLSFNDGLAVEPLLIFVHGVVSLSIPQLKLPAPKQAEDPFTTASGRPLRTDSLILAPTPKRKVAAAAQPLVAGLSKTAYVTNCHIIVEFGLLILSLLLKREKCHENSSAAVLPMLDPIIPIVYNKLNDPHSKTVALSLRCICVLLRVPLPSITEYAPKISTSIFTILHKYAGSTAGENYEMVQTAFKAISILVRHVTTHTIDEEQLRVLLTYAEQALCDPKQQSIAFGVLKAILKRKLTLEELPEVMLRVSELSIKAEAVPVRVQSRKVVLQYLIEYPLGKKVMRYLEFFLGQLDFEKEAGRLSAIEFLVSVFQSFPKNTLSQQCSLFLVTMSPHLINDTSSSCVKALAAALRTLIQQLNTPVASNLFDICLTWLKSVNVAHKRLAVQLCGIFAAAEGACFEFRLKELLPELIKVLDKIHSEVEDRDGDLLLIQAHYTITKIAQHCPNGLQNADNIELTDEMWNKVIHHLVHPHLWIRTLSARLVGTLMGWHKVDELASFVTNPVDRTVRTYFFCPDISSRLRSLASDSVAQLQSEQLDNQLADQVIKNLVFIAKVANRITAVDEEKELGVKPPTVPWLTGKLRREINAEVALRPKTPIKRVTVFKWMAAVAVDLNQVRGKEGLLPNLKFFVPPLTREVNDDGAPEEVKNLAQEVSDLIKGMVGTEAFSEVVVTASRNLAVRRRDRQAVRKAESVTKPDKTAQIRIKKQFAKRVAKKVKIAKLKGARPKLKDLAFRK